MLRRNVVARAISKWGRYGFGFALAAVTWLQPATARAVLMNYTGTFSMNIEGYSDSSDPFYGTADVNLATGAFQILTGWSTIPTTSGSYVTSAAEIRPPQQMTTTPSGSWLTTVTRHPIAQHPLLSLGGFSQGFVHVPSVWLPMSTGGSGSNLFFDPNGGFGGGFGGNAFISGASLEARFVNGMTGPSSYTRVHGVRGYAAGSTMTSRPASSYYENYPASISTYASATVSGYNWTANNASFTIDGRLYTAPGSDNRNTTNRTGQILLVTPIRIYAGMPNGGIGGYFNLEFDFTPVPEPSTAVLLGAGLVSLALAGRSRRAGN